MVLLLKQVARNVTSQYHINRRENSNVSVTRKCEVEKLRNHDT